MVRYTPDEFLNQYDAYISQCNLKKTGSVELTFKRYNANEEGRLNPSCDKANSREEHKIEDKEKKVDNNKKNKKNIKAAAKPVRKPAPTLPFVPSCLVRANFGKKRVSCVVPFSEIENFQQQFGTIFRAHTTALVSATGVSERLKKRRLASVTGSSKK